ncbi:Sigma54 specific transcriptional regulator, Fis family [Candidatus Accumulibacter aalborgensis]|uniref:Sigma54 specific transcriptional regulator, Fis family n=1 Tax=Candidatus Accumulibacter aalborgensis TaxID=1860102 RepID=A0A1A8XDD0_9PROT|nr:sigma-54-dependent Fis family transcriptional regulator [Candidatus Accumulibacter aalborgensis]SBT03210.1 Sigma54 specific transcriptional regulator, Fis family [Candidatus Accumulibacter aalborgensis]
MAVEQASLAELVSFLETFPEPHILCDRDYRILAANAAYRANWVDQTEVVGRKCFEVSHRYTVPCDQAGESCPLQRSLQSGQRERVLHLHYTSHGESFENIELSPIRDASGTIVYYVEKLEPLPRAPSLGDVQGLIGRSPAFVKMMELVARVAPSDASVLLQGESGTGKELVANAIHQLSRRAKHPFVAVDCSGLPETLFESALFGHERGAFTGATTRTTGLVEAASGGTLFLDELGDIPLSIQVKLLRLLETGTYRRVGSPELRKAEVRVVSATHRPLTEMVGEGLFRQDLFYRLNTFPIHLPPLRQRGDDVLLLAETLLDRVSGGRLRSRLSPEAAAWLRGYHYPGNVRELRNILERACLLCDGDEINLQHLPLELATARPLQTSVEYPPPAKRDFLESNSVSFEETVRNFKGSRKALASHLGLSERSLYRRLKTVDGQQR